MTHSMGRRPIFTPPHLLRRRLLAPHSSLAESRPVSLVASTIQTVKNAFPTPTRSHLLALIGSYFAVMSLVTIRRHVTFHSNGYDLGIFDQLIWSVSRGFPLESSILGYHFLGEHFSPIESSPFLVETLHGS